MRPPYLLLDIDGVLIPFPDTDGNSPPTHRRHQVLPSGRDPADPVAIWLNAAHGPLITDAINTGLISPVWCTSWRHDANRLIGPLLGLPPFPHIELPRPQITTSHPNGYLWKRDHVDALLDSSPLAWIDDDFTPLDHQWARQRRAAGCPTLLIQPNPRMGLQPSHLSAATAWAFTAAGEAGRVSP